MSNHMLEVPMGIKAGVCKAVELGRAAVTTVLAAPMSAAIGFGVGVLAVLVLKVIF